MSKCILCKNNRVKIFGSKEDILFCSKDCYDKWEASIDPKISKIYNEIIKELEDQIEHLEGVMCRRCWDGL